MSLTQTIMRMLDPTAGMVDQTFTLGDRGDQPGVEAQGAVHLKDAQIRTGGVLTHIENLLEADRSDQKSAEKAGNLTASLEENLKRLKALFRVPDNKDLIVREIDIATQPPGRAAVCFMEGMVNAQAVNRMVMEPVMLLGHLDHHVNREGEQGPTRPALKTLQQRLVTGGQVTEKYDMASIAEAILAGDTVILLDGERAALTVDTKGFPNRGVGEPKTEQVIQGAHDAFSEVFRINTALVRRRLKDPRLVTDVLKVGTVSQNYVALMYIDGIASPKLVAELKRRIQAIKVDIVGGAGILEQYIEDTPSALLPGGLTTERPDRVAAYLSEGHVAVLVDNSPHALITPITFWSLLQTPEDYYLRQPFGTFWRYIRFLSLIIALVVPAFYVALVNYHHEMIPTNLMMFVAASREGIPMPAVMEVILMEFTFELIREAGTRIPSVIGPTLGLVASLILGQAAVAAKIVSPLLIVVVAVTGLASFAIPNYQMGFGIRLLRLLLILASTVLGFYGVAAAIFVLTVYLSGLRSFGIPYLAPVAPMKGRVSDVLTRPALFKMEMRPPHVRPLNRRRQERVSRSWDPATRPLRDDEKGDRS